MFFSSTPTYDPEELIAYEIGYKTQFLNNTMRINGSFYLYDYDNVHTVGTEVTTIGGTSTSVLEAPGSQGFWRRSGGYLVGERVSDSRWQFQFHAQ